MMVEHSQMHAPVLELPVLELQEISKRFGPTVALDGVSLALQRGEVHALIGENGAGKSTLMNILAGSIQPDAGGMMVDGRPYAPASPLDARQHRIALIHQELSLCPHLSVAENILLGAEPSRRGWFDAETARHKALEVLKQFNHPEIRPRSARRQFTRSGASSRGDLPRYRRRSEHHLDG